MASRPNFTHFAGCASAEEVKGEYVRLAKVYKTDAEKMDSLNAEYETASAYFTMAEKPEFSEEQQEQRADVNESIRQAIEAVINLEGIRIEICGLWVWVHGDTKRVKETLKAAKYRWAPKKEGQPWYFAGVPAGRGRRRFTMDQIRHRYGSQLISDSEQRAS